MREKVIHVDEATHSTLFRIKDQLRKGSMAEVMQYFIEKYDEFRLSSRTIQTRDLELKEQYPCAFRFDHLGWYYCHAKGMGIVKKLISLKACASCKARLDQDQLLKAQQEILKQKIQALQLSLNAKIQGHKDQLYPTCKPLERQGDYGYEIRSDKCPNERVKDQWHPPDVCPVNCPFLKRVEIKKKKAVKQ